MKTTAGKSATTPKMYGTEKDISQKSRLEPNALMNQCLADAVDLQIQIKQARWNAKGPHLKI